MPVTDPLTSSTLGSIHVVLRPFQGDREYVRGEIVDTTEFRPNSVTSMIDRRYLGVIPYGFDYNATVVAEYRGIERRFMSQAVLEDVLATDARKAAAQALVEEARQRAQEGSPEPDSTDGASEDQEGQEAALEGEDASVSDDTDADGGVDEPERETPKPTTKSTKGRTRS